MSVNQVFLVGVVSGVPIHRAAGGGTPVCEFELITSETWTGKDGGANRTETERHQISVFGKLVEACQDVYPGANVAVVGKIKTSQYGPRQGHQYISVGFTGNVTVFGRSAVPIGAPDQVPVTSAPPQPAAFVPPPYVPGTPLAPPPHPSEIGRMPAPRGYATPVHDPAPRPAPRPSAPQLELIDDNEIPF